MVNRSGLLLTTREICTSRRSCLNRKRKERQHTPSSGSSSRAVSLRADLRTNPLPSRGLPELSSPPLCRSLRLPPVSITDISGTPSREESPRPASERIVSSVYSGITDSTNSNNYLAPATTPSRLHERMKSPKYPVSTHGRPRSASTTFRHTKPHEPICLSASACAYVSDPSPMSTPSPQTSFLSDS